VQVSIQKKKSSSESVAIVMLPKICKWYARDFGDGQEIEMIKLLLPFFPNDKQSLLLGRTGNGYKSESELTNKRIIVKYSNYNFKCRSLTLLDKQ